MPQDIEKGIAYLTMSADSGNQYSAQLLHSYHSGQSYSAAMGALRLLKDVSRAIQHRIDDEDRNRQHSIDSKIRRKIEEKKQAQGLH